MGDVDDQGNKTDTRTILAAVGSEIAADDQIIDIEGYEYSKDLTTEKNGGESVTVAAESLARSSVSGNLGLRKESRRAGQARKPWR